MNDELNIDIKTLNPFRRFIYTIGALPSSYLISMTYEEQLLWFCNYLEKTVIPTIDNNGLAVKELQDKYIELKSYVDNYFDDLDIQTEINNKLDEMADSGELENLIGQYIELQTTFIYNNVAEMKAATNLVNGSFAKTTGFYSYNDGGGAYYKIRTVTNADVIDEKFLIALEDNITLVAELMYKNELNYLQLGGKINDNTYDSTSLVQLMINTLSDKKAGKIYFPQGALYFAGTLTLKSNVELIGFGDYSQWNYNAETRQDRITTFHHIPSEECDFIITNTSDTSQLNYQPNINIKNLYIVGSENTSIGLNLIGISKSIIENIIIINCQTNIHIDYGMTTDFVRVYSQRASEYCLLIDKVSNIGVTTTLNFNNCYFGQTIESEGSPLKIDYNCCYGAYFNDCVLESSDKSIIIDTGNEVYFSNIYTENIPSSGTQPMFKLGVTTPTAGNEYEKGCVTINGGTIIGCNNWYTAGNEASIFDIDYICNLCVVGCFLKRADYTVKLTNNTDRITFIGTTEGQIAHGINTYKSGNKILYLNCNNTSFPIADKTFIPKATLTQNTLTLGNGWSAYGTGLQYAMLGNVISVYVSCTSGTVSNGTVIGTLPEGYRPASPVRIFLQNLSDDAYLDTNNYLMIKDNGDIRVVGSGFVNNKVYIGNVTFMIK